MVTLADNRLIYKTASGISTAVTAVQWKRCNIGASCPAGLVPAVQPICPAGKGVTLVPRDRVRNQPKQGASPVVHPQQQSSRTSNASSLLQWRSHKTHEQSQIPRDPLRQNAYIRTRRKSNQQNSGTRKDCPR